MVNVKTISAVVAAAITLTILPVGNAKAALITGVSASTDMGTDLNTNINNIVDGSGLSSLSLTATHAAATPITSWVAASGVKTGNIDFNLNGQYTLAGFSVWNFNANSIFGIKGVSISTSLDNIIYTALNGAPMQFAQGPFNADEPAEQFTVAPTLASYVRFNVLSNYGGTRSNLSEVQFDGTPVATAVPTPALLPGLIGMGVAAWRKRKAAAASEA